MVEASMRRMRMVMDFVRCMSARWRDFGRYCVRGCVSSEASLKKSVLGSFFEFVHNTKKAGPETLLSLVGDSSLSSWNPY